MALTGSSKESKIRIQPSMCIKGRREKPCLTEFIISKIGLLVGYTCTRTPCPPPGELGVGVD